MRRFKAALALAATAPLLTGCVFLPAIAAPAEPDEDAYIEAVRAVQPSLVDDELGREFTLGTGYLTCMHAEEGMSREEILEFSFDEVGVLQETLVDAAFDHLCPDLRP